MPHRERHWTDIVREKRDAREQALLPYLPAASNGHDLAFTNGLNGDANSSHPLTSPKVLIELQDKLLRREITAKQLTLAYIHNAVKAQQETNCLSETLFDQALDQAAQLDKYVATHGKLIGPFHGIPMSLKDQFNVKGIDSTLGYVGRAFKPAEDDSVLVDMLRRMGAVFIAKTNIPQSIMWCETENPLFGRTDHPLNPSLTPGGSSGGEGSLVALDGAMLGWGTDIGGSLRVPANMCGIYCLKPSSGRLPYQNVSVTFDGQEHTPSVVGPMSRSLPLIHQVTSSLLSLSPHLLDPKVHPIPWRQDVYHSASTRPLVIGLLLDDNVVRPHPPVTRALTRTADLLRAAGHHVVPWPAEDHAAYVSIMDEYYIADGCEDLLTDLSIAGEPPSRACKRCSTARTCAPQN